MVSLYGTDMKIPVRPAPAPPSNKPNRVLQQSSTIFDSWDDGNNDPFVKGNFTRSFSIQLDQPQHVKRKPPPRPPPPKFNHKNQQKQPGSRPSDVLSGLFSRRSNPHAPSANNAAQKQASLKEPNAFTASLIDFHSPSSSPTPTTRSSSDGVSVNSFGSDGSTSNNGQTPSGGNASIFENGFEDDFDFFGGLSSSSVNIPISEQKDPWSISPQDPFSPPRQQQLPQSSIAPTGNTTWFEDPSSESLKNKYACTSIVKPPPVTSAMPTIIRAKPNRPAALPKSVQHFQTMKPKAAQVFSEPNTPPAENFLRHPFKINTEIFDDEDFGFVEDSSDWSPPMPSIPPPPPPSEVLQEFEIQNPPHIPPRPFQCQPADEKKPYGIAHYDYPATHPDDLTLKANDVVFLTKKVNDEWLYGQIGERQGMFPANFVKIVIPLVEAQVQESRPKVPTVTALYSFSAEGWDDLEFPEGAVIQVLSRINADWLYGQYGEKSGQFPSSFVDHIPSGLPQRKV